MSEPIFRAWDNKKKKWFGENDYFIDYMGDIYIHKSEFEIVLDHEKDAVLCRSTGLKDKHGKMIFEGDIVNNSFDQNYIVEFSEGSFVVKMHNEEKTEQSLCVSWTKTLEIIGNIFDNPELLEKKQ